MKGFDIIKGLDIIKGPDIIKLNYFFQPLLISSPVAMRPETETQDKMLQTRPKTTPKVTLMLMLVLVMMTLV